MTKNQILSHLSGCPDFIGIRLMDFENGLDTGEVPLKKTDINELMAQLNGYDKFRLEGKENKVFVATSVTGDGKSRWRKENIVSFIPEILIEMTIEKQGDRNGK